MRFEGAIRDKERGLPILEVSFFLKFGNMFILVI